MTNPTNPTDSPDPDQLFEYPSDDERSVLGSNGEVIFTEPSSHPSTATPLDPFGQEVYAHQMQINQLFMELIEKGAPKGTEDTFVDSVVAIYNSRFYRRIFKNQDNYYKKDPEATVADPLVLKRALLGQATPSELLTIQKELKIPAIELARVTHPFGHRDKYVPGALELVTEALTEHGGILSVNDESMPADEFDIEFDSVILDETTEKQHDLLVLRKSTIGTVGNIVVRQRSAFIVRTKVCDAETIQALKSDPKRLMDDDNHEKLISLSTAWYAYAEPESNNLARRAILSAAPDQPQE